MMLALDANNQPVLFDLKGMLQAFIDHRREVVTKRCIFDLNKARDRAHILEGLTMALDKIDAVIAVIRASKETNTAKEALMSTFGFSDRQAQAILEMRLQRLTGLEREKIQLELSELMELIKWLNMVLADVKEIYKIIIKELEEIKEKFGDERRTKLEGSADDIEDEDLIAEESMIVTYTNTGYIKRMSPDEYRLQKRGGKGLKGIETREEDFVVDIFMASTKTTLLVFTDKGKLYWVKVHRLPLGNRTSKGKSIANVVNLSPNEKVMAVLPIEEFSESKFVVMITQQGVIKKTPLEAFSNPRQAGIIALTTDLDDNVIEAKLSDGQNDIFVATKDGMSIRFDEGDVRPMGRSARGVRGITLGKGDIVVSMEVVKKDTTDTLLMVTDQGFGKRTAVNEYRTQSRGGVGIITQKTTDKVGNVVTTKLVSEKHEVIITTDKGQVIRTRCGEISVLGRNTQGVKLININKEELVTGVATLLDTTVGVEDASSGEESIH
jgi:DNA gyrase subunit A